MYWKNAFKIKFLIQEIPLLKAHRNVTSFPDCKDPYIATDPIETG